MLGTAAEWEHDPRLTEPLPQQPCPACGTTPEEHARFCAQCGSPLHAGDTAEVELPLAGADAGPTGSGPAVERHLVGVAPPMLVGTLALVAIVSGLVLLALSHWVAGLVLLLAGIGLTVVFGTAARQPNAGPVARRALLVPGRLRGRAEFAVLSLTSWSGAGRKLARARVEQRRLRRAHATLIAALGDAVYREDELRSAGLKAELQAVDERLEQSERDLQSTLAATRARIDRERTAVQPTEVLKP